MVRVGTVRRGYHSLSSLKPQPLARIRTSLQPLALTMADSPARSVVSFACGTRRRAWGGRTTPPWSTRESTKMSACGPTSISDGFEAAQQLFARAVDIRLLGARCDEARQSTCRWSSRAARVRPCARPERHHPRSHAGRSFTHAVRSRSTYRAGRRAPSSAWPRLTASRLSVQARQS